MTKKRKIPSKYLAGLGKKKRKQMRYEIRRFRDKPDDYKKAYRPWSADKGVKPKRKSKATRAYHRMFGEDEDRNGKWDITHKDLPNGSMLLIQHSTGKRRTLPRAAAAKMRSKLKRLDIQWEQGEGDDRYPNVHKHIDAVLEPFFEDVSIQESAQKGLAAKAKASGVPLSILRQVFKRGMAAWKTGHRPGVAQQQWAYGRVNSFITGKGKARQADSDLWTKAKKKMNEEAIILPRTLIQLEAFGILSRLFRRRKATEPESSEGGKSLSDIQKRHADQRWAERVSREHRAERERGRRSVDRAMGKPVAPIPKRTTLTVESICDNRKLNKPWRTSGGPKKFAVCVSGERGPKIVRFGDPNLEIKRDDPERRKNFRARHGCDNPGPRTKAKYWSCKFWEKGRPVSKMV